MARKTTQGKRTQATGQPIRQKRKSRNVLYAPIAFVLICLSVILAMSIFFRVNEIDVVGNQTYTAEEVIEASGVDTGDNLFFINKLSVGSRLITRLPHIQSATVDRKLPDKVTITVTESNSIAYVASGNALWMIDRNCKLMGKVNQSDTGHLIQISGVEPLAPAVGDEIVLGDDEAGKVSYLKEILTEIDVRGLTEQVTNLDISSVANPTFLFQDRFTVKLGSRSETEQKFGILLSAVDQLSAGDAGTIDLSIDKRAHFTQS
ncbi:MAG: FtsQ-type POTRA domain-containing protein [Oscillospiraceae bacterium]|nr:FtsQ-type POTRA domain-containing protein [Oscillospiraceae bacterium]